MMQAKSDVGYHSLSKKKWEKQACVTKQGLDGIQKLVKRWQKCIDVCGYYVEK